MAVDHSAQRKAIPTATQPRDRDVLRHDRGALRNENGASRHEDGAPCDEADDRPPTREVGDVRKAAERRRRRAVFLRELKEAKELRARVQPRRARAARMRQQMRMRTFRW
ncbi:hypothetical protein [Streptantibioticus silvisoli]|uniref:hypothetical protein n=1 Tax=Streptantibioticus silvisoli TaxID=2705255 RepID=UPI003FD7D600